MNETSSRMQEIVDQINQKSSEENNGYSAEISEAGPVVIRNSNQLGADIFMMSTDSQIITITPLFSIDSVTADRVNELNRLLLTITLPMALSSFAIQDNGYVLQGSMSINTTIENVLHEIDVQMANYDDAMDALDEFIA